MPQLAHFFLSHNNCSSLLQSKDSQGIIPSFPSITLLALAGPESQPLSEDTIVDCGFVFLSVEGRCRRGSYLSYWPARIGNKAVCGLQFCEKSDMTGSLCLGWRSATSHPGLSAVTRTMLEDWRLLSETFSSPLGMLGWRILITLHFTAYWYFNQHYTFH